jgi:hypothetical protein
MNPLFRSPPSVPRLAIVTAIALAWAASSADARPNIREAFFSAYPGAVGSRLDNLPSIAGHCGVCHYRFTGGGNRNPYGSAVEAALPGYPNSDAGRLQAVQSVQNQDSDTDAYASLAEVTDLASYSNTPTFPGLNSTNVSSVTNVNVNEITPYLTPQPGLDGTPPVVSVTSPNGAQSWEGGSVQSVTWTATDNVGVTGVDVYYRDGEAEPWTQIARGLANSGSFAWSIHDTPTASARVKVVAWDTSGNQGSDQSDLVFTITKRPGGIVPTSLRDFHQPGSQPFQAGFFQDRSTCATCHGGYAPAVEPDRNFRGSMMAQAGRDPLAFAAISIAEQDAPNSGDLCLRCHTPFAWLSGRSNPTDGTAVTAFDRDGVSCDFCHRIVDPVYVAGQSPPEDQAALNALLPADVPSTYLNGQYVIDAVPTRRGPFTDPVAPHAFLASPVHRSSRFCGTCHDVSNPAFAKVGEGDYAPGPLDQKAAVIDAGVLMPVERTYSEWLHSAYPAGVYAPDFAGNKPDGIVSTCQDCHMRDVSGKGCNDPAAATRPDLPLHDMTGGNSWVPTIIDQVYPGEVDPAALADGAARAVSMLGKAAGLDLAVVAEGDSFRADVTVTNRTGHKLPTGYPEGRRVWLEIVARNGAGVPVYRSGAYDPATGVLTHDPDLVLYEVELGLSPGLAALLGLAPGPSFHFVLNDTVYKDNRIPPAGFTNADFAVFGGKPVDPGHPGPEPRYADGQNWDLSSFALPPATRSVAATIWYQTTSKEMVTFLRDENVTDSKGDLIYDLWEANGKSPPVVMVHDSVNVDVTAVLEEPGRIEPALRVAENPFRGDLGISLSLGAPEQVTLEVFDVRGRCILRRDEGLRGPGVHALVWDGRDAGGTDQGSGVFWVRVPAREKTLIRRVVRVR